MQIAPVTDDKPRHNAPKHPQHRITGKVRAAIDAMVWHGLPRDQAAEKAGISDHGLYKALRSPPVKAYYLAECEVLRVSGRARNIHRLEQIRDAADNMPAVNAIKTLEQLGDEQAQRGSAVSASPGVTIRIVQVVQQVAAPDATFSAKMTDANEIKQIDGVTADEPTA